MPQNGAARRYRFSSSLEGRCHMTSRASNPILCRGASQWRGFREIATCRDPSAISESSSTRPFAETGREKSGQAARANPPRSRLAKTLSRRTPTHSEICTGRSTPYRYIKQIQAHQLRPVPLRPVPLRPVPLHHVFQAARAATPLIDARHQMQSTQTPRRPIHNRDRWRVRAASLRCPAALRCGNHLWSKSCVSGCDFLLHHPHLRVHPVSRVVRLSHIRSSILLQ